jgi:subtilisin family serine protease/N-acetylneuraminic acid mutarotase
MRDWKQRGEYVVDELRKVATASQREVRETLDGAKASYQAFWVANTILVDNGPTALAQDLATAPGVVELHEVPRYDVPELLPATATPKAAAVEWGVANIHADRVWDELDVRGEDLVIASIDTGVQFDHPSLAATYRGAKGDGTFDHNYNWFDPSEVCGSPSVEPCDNIFHGTHTMGTMVGGDGPEGRIGVAPGARWITAKGCEDEDRGCTLGALLASGQWMLAPTDLAGRNARPELRPHIINNSWGDHNRSVEDPYYDEVVDVWNDAGIFAVFSNGNDGRAGCDTSGSPADGAHAYAVGAYDAANRIGDFSSRGPGGPGDLKPDIAAPGVNVRSAVPDNRFAVASGTSMAAPHVAGTVALMWSAAPSLIGDVDGTRELLASTAVDTEDLSCGGSAQENNVFGEGRLDAYAATAAAPIGDTGRLVGQVTNAETGDPLADATVRATSAGYQRSTTTDAEGRYELTLVAGTYDVAVSAYGYADATLSSVVVAKEQTTTSNPALTALPMTTITGRVTDGSGHGWPLYAGISVAGTPLGTIHTSPSDGTYRLQLPVDTTYRFAVRVEYPGYQTVTREIAVGSGAQTVDFAVPVNGATCAAPGYRTAYAGMRETFDAGTLPAGWERSSTIGDGWLFDDPGRRTNLTGGAGKFASIDSADGAAREDGTLTTPAVDLSDSTNPVVEFRTDFLGNNATVNLTLSTDGGATWQSLWTRGTHFRGPQTVRIPVPDAAGKTDVRARFHYVNAISNNGWWQVDDVLIGSSKCEPTPGGLVVGNVRDDRAGDPVNKAVVHSVDRPAERATAAETPDDPALADGFYWMFSSLTGPRAFHAAYDFGQYEARTKTVDVQPDGATRVDFGLGMGELTITPGSLEQTVELGGQRSVNLTLTNVGTGRASYDLAELDGSFEIANTPQSAGGAPLQRFPNTDTGGALSPTKAVAGKAVPSADGSWTRHPDLPIENLDVLAAYHDGKLYSIGGWSGAGPFPQFQRVFDFATQTWSTIADTEMRAKPVGGFIGDKLYVVGGWSYLGEHTSTTQIYSPATNSWSRGADAPVRIAAAASAVLDGKLYVIGGRTQADPLHGSREVVVYDPATDAWSKVADYPEPTSWTSCGAIGDRIYCAGGQDGGSPGSRSAYAYSPRTNAWYRLPDLPRAMWGGAYTAANGKLLMSGGIVGGYRSNEGFAFDPATNAWTALPNSLFPLTRVAGTCGFYKVAGSEGVFGNKPYVEQLTGFSDCASGGRDVPWLSVSAPSGSLAPGESRTVTLTVDASLARIAQPGSYSARLLVHESTPYRNDPLTLKLTATPPASWGKVSGTVTGLARCDAAGGPLAGGSVRLDGKVADVSVAVDAAGRYAYWLDAANQPLRVTASGAGFVPVTRMVGMAAGRTTVTDFQLRRSSPCATVSPASLEVSVKAGERGSGQLTLANDGAVAYSYSLTTSAAWLSVNRAATGTIAADRTARLTLLVDGRSFVRGQTYTATATVTTTDPGQPVLTVPVSVRAT